jgi:hypothetical protein
MSLSSDNILIISAQQNAPVDAQNADVQPPDMRQELFPAGFEADSDDDNKEPDLPLPPVPEPQQHQPPQLVNYGKKLIFFLTRIKFISPVPKCCSGGGVY